MVDINSDEVQAVIQEQVAAQVAKLEERHAAAMDEAVEGLRNKNHQLLGEVKKLKSQVRDTSELPDDFNPEEWAKYRKDKANAAEELRKAQGDWEGYKKELQEAHARELEQRDAAAAALRAQLDNELVTNAITGSIGKAKGSIDLLLPHLRNAVKLIDEDGVLAARVVDAKGTPRIDTKTGDFLSIDQLLEEMKNTDTFAPCFEGTRASGSGARGGAGGSAQQNPWAGGSLNLTEQGRITRENPGLAAKLKSEAGVA